MVVCYRYLQQFGNICGIFDVSLSDLLRPTAERMRLLASAAADYIEFQETHLPEALQKWEVVERNRAQIEALRDEVRASLEGLYTLRNFKAFSFYNGFKSLIERLSTAAETIWIISLVCFDYRAYPHFCAALFRHPNIVKLNNRLVKR